MRFSSLSLAFQYIRIEILALFHSIFNKRLFRHRVTHFHVDRIAIDWISCHSSASCFSFLFLFFRNSSVCISSFRFDLMSAVPTRHVFIDKIMIIQSKCWMRTSGKAHAHKLELLFLQSLMKMIRNVCRNDVIQWTKHWRLRNRSEIRRISCIRFCLPTDSVETPVANWNRSNAYHDDEKGEQNEAREKKHERSEQFRMSRTNDSTKGKGSKKKRPKPTKKIKPNRLKWRGKKESLTERKIVN